MGEWHTRYIRSYYNQFCTQEKELVNTVMTTGEFSMKSFQERLSFEPFDIYVAAIDTIEGIYQTQVQKGQINSHTYIDEHGQTKWAGGSGKVNLVLKKK